MESSGPPILFISLCVMSIVLSPAPSHSVRDGAAIQASWAEYERRNNGDTGEFGFCFDLPVDMNTAPTEAQLVEIMKERQEEAGVEATYRSRRDRVRQLLSAHQLLKPGTQVWLKKGLKVFALAEITSDYRYAAEERWGWHSWAYKLIRPATEAERGHIMGRKTFIARAKGL